MNEKLSLNGVLHCCTSKIFRCYTACNKLFQMSSGIGISCIFTASEFALFPVNHLLRLFSYIDCCFIGILQRLLRFMIVYNSFFSSYRFRSRFRLLLQNRSGRYFVSNRVLGSKSCLFPSVLIFFTIKFSTRIVVISYTDIGTFTGIFTFIIN